MVDLESDEDYNDEFNNVISDPNILEADQVSRNNAGYDSYINIKVALPHGPEGQPRIARVVKRSRGPDGLPIGTAHDNPLLDTRLYTVQFQDGYESAMTANQIAENLFAQVDKDGNRFVLLDEIIDHRVNDDAVALGDEFFTTSMGTRQCKKTTKGWELLIKWKDGSTNWFSLKDIKQAYPAEVAEYAAGNQIEHMPAFAWWVPWVTKHKGHILGKLKIKYWLRTHKYGIKLPKNVEHAYEIDRKNGNTL